VNEHTDQVQLLFDSKAARWPRKYQPQGPLAGRLVLFSEAVRSLVPPGSELLDLGCGSGELARHLTVSDFLVSGCDIAPEMLRQARAADTTGAVRWIKLDAPWHTLPFSTAVFDAVLASSVLEYVLDPAAVLAECARVLRPGGSLLCTVPEVTHPVRWLEWPLGLVARTPLAKTIQRGCPRFSQYLTYLRISRHRRGVRWWHAVARGAGLRPVPLPGRAAERAPLRLLVFTTTECETVPAQPSGGNQ
jgi:SAM-dependent methyltransferase